MYGYAREKGYYIGDSPMAWRGALEHVLKAPRDVHRVVHHTGLNYQTAPTFLQQHLRTYQYNRAWPIGLGPDGRPINQRHTPRTPKARHNSRRALMASS